MYMPKSDIRFLLNLSDALDTSFRVLNREVIYVGELKCMFDSDPNNWACVCQGVKGRGATAEAAVLNYARAALKEAQDNLLEHENLVLMASRSLT